MTFVVDTKESRQFVALLASLVALPYVQIVAGIAATYRNIAVVVGFSIGLVGLWMSVQGLSRRIPSTTCGGICLWNIGFSLWPQWALSINQLPFTVCGINQVRKSDLFIYGYEFGSKLACVYKYVAVSWLLLLVTGAVAIVVGALCILLMMRYEPSGHGRPGYFVSYAIALFVFGVAFAPSLVKTVYWMME